MKKNSKRLAFLFCALLPIPPWAPGRAAEAESSHKAPHGGGLNAIEACEIGHAEVMLENGVLKLWLLGGDNETETAAPIKAEEIPLLILAGGEAARALVLKASPLVLAEETPGNCSHFAAAATWLDGVEEFIAVGAIHFKGAARVLRISYPEPFDPDHE
jgi:hypothetical protein